MDHIIRLGTGELSPELLPTKQIEQSLKEISIDSFIIKLKCINIFLSKEIIPSLTFSSL